LAGLSVGGHDGGYGAVVFADELVEISGVERLQGEVVDPCGGRHNWTCAESGTLPIGVARSGVSWGRGFVTLELSG
jgi:hypothetical protein